MRRYGLLGVILLASYASGCCWRPAWCQQQYAQPMCAPGQAYQTYQPPTYVAPQAASPCTCY